MKKEYKPLVKKSKRRNELLSNNAASIIKKENRKLIKIIATICIVLITVLFVSCLITIYNFFYSLHPYAGYASLAVVLLTLIIFVIIPAIKALSSPCFTLDVVDVSSKKTINRVNFQKLKKVADNLSKSEHVSEESKKAIEASLGNRDELNKTLRDIYDKEISKTINRIIAENSTRVLLSTALSQNDRFDALTVALVNIRMIMRIVIECGYRPTYAQISKLIIKVFRNALIAYTLQAFNIDKLIFNGIDKLVNGALSAIPVVKKISESLTQGAANALLTLRIGIITRKYLYEEFDIQAMIDNPDETNEEILTSAVKEANDNIDTIISNCKKNAEAV